MAVRILQSFDNSETNARAVIVTFLGLRSLRLMREVASEDGKRYPYEVVEKNRILRRFIFQH